ncbi:hypothetical protein [Halobacterium sp. R2-5]|uniref:hypothetical protein n=1 Tax=Halobacterium sp. R2-5 TaxID=2715751 RepID=UPI00141F588E|nr:hypothetical protein [Halobacterium sp. R2-5]NIC00894.1 hypothetical protein [Halobacterium sp. R2-5]
MNNLDQALQNKTVLFLTPFEEYEPRISRLLSELTVEFANTTSEAYRAIDETVAVICVSDNVLTEEFEDLRTDVLLRHPFCQFVAIESEPLSNPLIDDYDVILNGPVSSSELHDTIKERVIYAAYSSTLQEYYHLNTYLSTFLEDAQEPSEKPPKITNRVETLRTILQTLQAELSEDHLREISKTVQQHKQYVTQPGTNSGNSASSKYHPDTCPQCGVAWGEDHGNELERGYANLGAGVWKCKHCESITHSLHDNQRVTKQ